MIRIPWRRYGIYLLRWQLSTPPLAFFTWLIPGPLGSVVANFIGGLGFFWIDRFIFTSRRFSAQWEIEDDVKCADCGKIARGYRIVKMGAYNREDDPRPKYRCESCSIKKAEELKMKYLGGKKSGR